MTPHFTLDELCHSQAASRMGLDNTPPVWMLPNLQRLANGLEQVRELTGKPISISSGYRSPSVNQAVGGAAKSQHVDGNAADITCPGFGSTKKLVEAIVKSDIQYDQCILEFVQENGAGGWCHISFADKPRKQALVIDSKGTRVFA